VSADDHTGFEHEYIRYQLHQDIGKCVEWEADQAGFGCKYTSSAAALHMLAACSLDFHSIEKQKLQHAVQELPYTLGSRLGQQ
jgi:hypothetical protein